VKDIRNWSIWIVCLHCGRITWVGPKQRVSNYQVGYCFIVAITSCFQKRLFTLPLFGLLCSCNKHQAKLPIICILSSYHHQLQTFSLPLTLKLSSINLPSSSYGVLFQSVAVSTTWCQSARPEAFLHAEERPMFRGLRSASTERKQV